MPSVLFLNLLVSSLSSFHSFIVSPVVLKDGGIWEEAEGTAISRMATVCFEVLY